jgi:hypothetical protein
MSEKAQILVIIAVILGSFVGAWVWGVTTGNLWPVIGWFAVAVTLAAAGG